MITYLLNPQGQDERLSLLTRLLDQIGAGVVRVDSAEQLRTKLASRSAEGALVIAPDLSPGSELAPTIVQLAQALREHAFFVYVSDALSGDAYKALLRTGSGEWISWQNLPAELGDVVRRGRPALPTIQTEPARIVTGVPTSGGVGTTTVLLETAVLLASQKRNPRRTCLLDLNFQASSLPSYLDLEPRLQITDIINDPRRLDAHLVEMFTTKHSSGVDVFASPASSLDYAALDPEVIFALVDQISRHYDVVFLDLPPAWFPWIDNVVAGSDGVLLVGRPNIPSIQRTQQRLTFLKELGFPPERTAAVINNARFGLFGSGPVRRADISRSLPDYSVFYVRHEPTAAADALSLGRSVIQAGRARGFRKDIGRLAEWVARVPQKT